MCAALRQSWTANDGPAAAVAARQLYELFPDLMPAKAFAQTEPTDYYQLLGISPDKTNQQIAASYMKEARKKLIACRKQGIKMPEANSYWGLLDAGFILRKPRLRLSHDLIVCHGWLVNEEIVSADSAWDFTAKFKDAKEPEALEPPIPMEEIPAEKKAEKQPRVIELLQIAQLIGPDEVRALEAQTARAPDVSVERLVLDSGYVTRQEMNSLKLAELLLDEGKINIAQFQVAMYDERNSGIRMAESLQTRGWLPVDLTQSN